MVGWEGAAATEAMCTAALASAAAAAGGGPVLRGPLPATTPGRVFCGIFLLAATPKSRVRPSSSSSSSSFSPSEIRELLGERDERESSCEDWYAACGEDRRCRLDWAEGDGAARFESRSRSATAQGGAGAQLMLQSAARRLALARVGSKVDPEYFARQLLARFGT